MDELDIAYNTRLYGYKVGNIKDRPQRSVIRIRKVEGGGRNTTRATRGTMDAIASDDSKAGHSFGPEELNFTKVPGSELVVVVGQLLAEDGLSPGQVEKFETPSRTGRRGVEVSVADFSTQAHHLIDTQPGKHIVVCKLFVKKHMNLFVLVRKEDGLCEAAPLPSANTISTRLVYYSEWTDSPARKWHPERGSDWKKNIAQFCSQYIKDNRSKILDPSTSTEARRPAAADAPRDPILLGSPAGLDPKPVSGLTDRAKLAITIVRCCQELLKPIVQSINDTMNEEQVGLGGGATAEPDVKKPWRTLEHLKRKIETIISEVDELVSTEFRMGYDGRGNANDADDEEERGDGKEDGVEEEERVGEEERVEEKEGVEEEEGVEEDEGEWETCSSSSEGVKEDEGFEEVEEEWGGFSSSESERPRKKVKTKHDRV